MIENKDISTHNDEIQKNLEYWNKKPLLKDIYLSFYQLVAKHLSITEETITVELGSGIGNIKDIIPNCIRTDIFPNPWIDQIENAYTLSFDDNSVDNLILIDVFHHLRYPGTAMNEFQRVLKPNGRLIIFDPCMSLLGYVIYGLLHHEDIGLKQDIQMYAPEGWTSDQDNYYAAQGNASRIFSGKKYRQFLTDWNIQQKQKISAISYVASGGYSKPKLYPRSALPFVQSIEKICDLLPPIFATRILIVLEKTQ